MHKSKIHVNLILILLLTTFFSISLYAPSTANSTIPILYIDPPSTTVNATETFKINVTITDVTDLAGWELKLYYRNSILAAVKATEGSFLKQGGSTAFFIVEFNNNYNATHGRIWLTCTLLGNVSGVNGTGTLTTITFKTNATTGLSILDLAETTLSDSSANTIPHRTIDGKVYLGTPPEIKVPRDYPTIQQAINAATIGTTILVSNGTYFEQLTVNKTVSLIGEDKSTTIINANNSNTALLITANDVSIRGFTIENATSYALYFNYSSFNKICDNIIKNNGYGIYLNNSIKNTITNNLIFENTQDGIRLTGTATITNNTIKLNGNYGIYLYLAYANITENKIELNKYGMSLYHSGGNIIRKNDLLNNTQNFSVDGEQLSDYIQNIDYSNKINKKTIYYLINQKDCIISPDNLTNIGYLGIVNSTNICITNFNITNNGEGILLAFTKNSIIENINVERSSVGIKCVSSQNNSITQTTLKNNFKGIELKNSQNNEIRHNTIINNHYAFYLYHSNNNTIYHNNIINNTQQVYASSSINNRWDNGYQGNYWSSYNGTDKDHNGIGDTQYIVDKNQTDRYPLIHPYIPDVAITDIIVNSTKVYVGQTVTLTISVMNKWYETETFNLTIYANYTSLKTFTISNLTSYSKATLTFYWNTSYLTPGKYAISAQAEILPGEIEIDDNVNTDGIIEVLMLDVDFNGDDVVNVLDLRIVAIYFGEIGDSPYDLNFDNIVDIEDLQIVVANYG